MIIFFFFTIKVNKSLTNKFKNHLKSRLCSFFFFMTRPLLYPHVKINFEFSNDFDENSRSLHGTFLSLKKHETSILIARPPPEQI